MFTGITSGGIVTQATTFTGEFESPMLVAIGLGVAFAAVRFLVGIFY